MSEKFKLSKRAYMILSVVVAIAATAIYYFALFKPYSSKSKEIDVSKFDEKASQAKVNDILQLNRSKTISTVVSEDYRLKLSEKMSPKNSESLIEQETGLTSIEIEKKVLESMDAVDLSEPYKIVEPYGNTLSVKPDAKEVSEQFKPIISIEKNPDQPKQKNVVKSSACEELSRPRVVSLITNADEIRNNNIPAFWQATNNSKFQVAIIVKQDNKSVGIVFLPSKTNFSSRVAATQLKFEIKKGTQSCVDWKGKGGIHTAFPLDLIRKGVNRNTENTTYYANGNFETVIEDDNQSIRAKTTLLGSKTSE